MTGRRVNHYTTEPNSIDYLSILNYYINCQYLYNYFFDILLTSSRLINININDNIPLLVNSKPGKIATNDPSINPIIELYVLEKCLINK